MKVAVDAANIISGGGLTHLVELLSQSHLAEDVEWVVVGPSQTLDVIPRSPNVYCVSPWWCNGSYFFRFIGRFFFLGPLCYRHSADVIFSPGGIVPTFSNNLKTVAMSQNLLPFELREAIKFSFFSKLFWKMMALRVVQTWSFRRANAVLFLSDYAYRCVSPHLSAHTCTAVVPHGISPRFKPLSDKKNFRVKVASDGTIKVLYVSTVAAYKNQLQVVEAVQLLRERGWNIELTLVGEGLGSYARDLFHMLKTLDGYDQFVTWKTGVRFEEIHKYYQLCDFFVFASSCENFPNIALEAMASGAPILSSNRGPMPEIFGDTALYFDPDNVIDIATVMERALQEHDLISENREQALKRASIHSWGRTFTKTVEFLRRVVG